MKIRFLGAVGGSVTGSCTHFYYQRTNTQFLVDCGVFQGEAHMELENRKPFHFQPSEIRFLILTHAHADHCGLLIRLYKEGFRGKVYCTTATAKLTRLMLNDLVSLDRRKNSSASDRRMYSDADTAVVGKLDFDCLDQRWNFGLSRLIPIDQDLLICFLRSAHILGSVSVVISWISELNQKQMIVMSGDLGSNTKENAFQSLLGFRQSPFGYPDYMVVESTYGSMVRRESFKDFENRILRLAKIVRETVVLKKQILVIPAFSLQRSQDILFDLYYIFTQKQDAVGNVSSRVFSDDVLYDIMSNESWSKNVHWRLLDSIASLPSDELERWHQSLDSSHDSTKYFLKFGSHVKISEVVECLALIVETYPIEIVLDSKLTFEVTKVFRDELNRPQIIKPEEALFRNSQIAKMFDLDSKAKVDQIIDEVFSCDEQGLDIKGGVKIRHPKHFTLPDQAKLSERGTILISGAGSCEGGPIVQHLPTVLRQEGATILLTGYMSKNTVGAKMQQLAKHRLDGTEPDIKAIDVGPQTIPVNDVRADIQLMGDFYSGHADQEGLIDFIFKFRQSENESPVATTVFLNHGSEPAREKLKDRILAAAEDSADRKIKTVELPSKDNRWYDLDKGRWDDPVSQDHLISLIQTLISEQARTNLLLDRLLMRLDSPDRNVNGISDSA